MLQMASLILALAIDLCKTANSLYLAEEACDSLMSPGAAVTESCYLQYKYE